MVSGSMSAYLHHLKLLQAVLTELLDTARVIDGLVLVKSISRPALRVLSEVVC